MNFLKAKTKILLLAANPQDTSVLRLGEEIRNIKESLQLGKYRDNFTVRQGEAVRIQDFIRLVLTEKPNILHFSGHATTEGICLENDNGLIQLISGKTLSKLLEECENLECVILNSCYSESQANEIKKTVPFVIGTTGKLNDKSAIRFSSGFYYALAENIGIEKSFNYGFIAASMEIELGIKPSRSLDIKNLETITESPILIKGQFKINKATSKKNFFILLILIPIPFLIYAYYPHKQNEEFQRFITIKGDISEEVLSNELERIPIPDAIINFPQLTPEQNEETVSTRSIGDGTFEKRYKNLTELKPSDSTLIEVTHPNYKTGEFFLSIYETMPIHLYPIKKPED